MFYLAAVPPRILTFTENRTYQVSALATETRRHRSRRRHALVFRFRSDAQSYYFPCSPAFDQLRAFYIRNDRGSYKETFFICPRSSSRASSSPCRGILYFSLFSVYLLSNKQRVPRSGNKGSREAGKPQSGNTPGDVVNIGKLEIG